MRDMDALLSFISFMYIYYITIFIISIIFVYILLYHFYINRQMVHCSVLILDQQHYGRYGEREI